MTDKNKGGRPPKFKTAEEMQHRIDLYFMACRAHQTGKSELLEELSTDDLLIINDIDDVVPTVCGLAYELDMSRVTFSTYAKKDEFLNTIKKARQKVEKSLEQRLATNCVAGTIFNLKNNFDWKDKTETALTGKDGGPIALASADLSDDQLAAIAAGK